ncbi:hypothetical protein QM787_04305 [Rhodococcus ruber]|uniref:Uncharacterized protein n=1 Tax=Rhodococcus ruber TaxID=1830 RepID=A0A098BUE7_9NOCA|nr:MULTISPECIES: hypothetical protein [Rhodococcus]MCD2127723.1 hypothetical protein [Rhodococcus ruber]MCZ1071693.1 hypothetical protein [Rhodococcus sp. A5(2022)]MCZ4504381.1 hypothetical protein [Rhodococcus ruber]MCZ4529383.1 hypothetical protein [Rhodococcus ruber]MCZ4621042.1 hypothetical protein [Rhodococcus ruber]
MNPRHIVLIVGAGMFVSLLMKAPELSAGTFYAIAMSVSYLGPRRKRVDLGTADSYAAASDRIYQDSMERTAKHGDVRYGSSPEGVSATYDDGTVLLYQLEPIDAEVEAEASTTGADGTETVLGIADADAPAEPPAFTRWPVHEVAWAEPTPFLRLQLKRVDISRQDGTVAKPFWTLVFGKPSAPDLIDPAIPPSMIPALIGHLSELYATWVLHTHERTSH